MPLTSIYVALGGAIGSSLRYAVSVWMRGVITEDFPYATFAINIIGSGLMGVWIGVIAAMAPERARDLQYLVAIGVLGGFTTFSTFSLDLYLLLEKSLWQQALLYAGGSVLLSLFALIGGLQLMRYFA